MLNLSARRRLLGSAAVTAVAGVAGLVVSQRAAAAATATFDATGTAPGVVANSATSQSAMQVLSTSTARALWAASTGTGAPTIQADQNNATAIDPAIQGLNLGTGPGVSGAGVAVGTFGRAVSRTWRGVYGIADSATGASYGVYGEATSTSGFGVFSKGALKCTGRAFVGAPNSAPTAASLAKGSLSFFLSEATDELKVRVKYSYGTIKNGTIALA